MDILYQLLPIITVFAAGSGTTSNSTLGSNILGWVSTVGGAIAAALIIVSLVKDVASYAKGSGDGSVLKIAGKVLFLLVILGTIAYVNTHTDGGGVANVAGQLVNTAGNEITNTIK